MPGKLFFFILSLLVVSIAPSVQGLEKVALQLKWHHQFQFAGYYAALEKGFYRDAGLDVRIIEGKLGLFPVEEVVKGNAHYGVAGPEVLIQRLKGKPVIVLSVIFQHSPRVIIAKADAGIHSPQDLPQKARWMGDLSKNYAEVYAMLIKEGIPLDLMQTDTRWSLEEFSSGEWNAFSGYLTAQPFQLEQMGVPITIIRPSTYGIDFYGDSLITSEQEIEDHPERAERFRQASLKGWKYAMANPDELIGIILTRYGAGEQGKTREELAAEAESMRELILPDLIELGHTNEGRWQHMAKVYEDLGIVEGDIPLDGFIYDPDPAPNVERLYWITGVSFIVSLFLITIALVLLKLNRRLKGEIAERRLVEKELLKRSLALEQSDSTIVITDVDGNIEYVNPAFSRITGYRKEEVIGRNPRVLKSGKQSAEFYRQLWDTLMSGNTWRGEMVNKKADGELFWELVAISPVKEQSGEIINYVAIKEDITSRKAMEEALHKAKIGAESANQAKSIFLANMSHELRTPLNAIIGFAQVLEKQIADSLTDKQRKYFKTIRESGDHLLEMVNDILDLAKIEAGKSTIEKKPFDFEVMLRRAIAIAQVLADKKNQEIRIDIQANLGWIDGDETRLKQVIYNLLSNAVKFTQPSKSIGLDAHYESDYLTVTVWDEGIGIPDHYQEKIFDPFEQHTVAKMANEEGTGLGLAISKRFVELHGGILTVKSRIDKGSRFTVTLPGRIQMEDQLTDGSDSGVTGSQAVSKRRLSILLTEDNPTNVELLAAALEYHDLDIATTGEEAVLKACENRYDVILMDIQLPEMSGVDAMLRIRRSSGRSVPIWAITAFAMKGDKESYLEQGFDDYVSKPLDVDLLLSKLNGIADGSD